ncbi:TfoX/Sxy family protein [Planctomicrobium piriforme]|uniref:TfoX N-terminal domain-containing protein n=1 Tax=Planctomicrobium piriforme TaxID=1576369 RepID=A0A1I3FDE7_9PLAN|nr:TfoX/Sxy family protein [Planctomicrobium piriforme]SFI09200.1 TfoX N-terminal domain-containing protein [Planctomicrobium piriforme]
MAYDEQLAIRVRSVLARKKNIEEKKMFGGVAFLLNGRMLVGVWKEFLIARLGPEQGEHALREPYVQPFDITGKPMRNWVMVGPEALEGDDDLTKWIDRSMRFVKTLPKKK